MSTELNEVINSDENIAEQKETTEIDYKAWYEQNVETIERLPGLVEKNRELLAEAKKVKDEKRKAEETLAKQNGEYEKLAKQYEDELRYERQERRSEKIKLQATKLAAELTKGDTDKAELLEVFLTQSLDSIADEKGQLDNALLSNVRKQFETDKKYQPLLGGNGSVGGSAPGNTRSATITNTITRAEFDKMNDVQRREFFAKSGKLED